MTEPQAAPTGGWRQATVRQVEHPNPNSVLLRLDVADRIDHLPGQHYVVRLTAPDGYVAQRSYSIASAPSDPLVELFVARLDDGEVSTYLADVVEVGDELEVRGPIGGWFVWDGTTPAAGIGGGTGVVPLVAMARHARHLQRPDLLQLIVSARTISDLPYAEELITSGAHIALTRSADPAVTRPLGRINSVDLDDLTADAVTWFVCGSAQLAEAASQLLIAEDVPATAIKVERFGPSGPQVS